MICSEREKGNRFFALLSIRVDKRLKLATAFSKIFRVWLFGHEYS